MAAERERTTPSRPAEPPRSRLTQRVAATDWRAGYRFGKSIVRPSARASTAARLNSIGCIAPAIQGAY